ncbi:VOC family protein [Clostridium sp.]|uniref:VOC family protein n=2 Tax=Clostridium sp. TaxID=1506 RepID=UPI00321749CD
MGIDLDILLKCRVKLRNNTMIGDKGQMIREIIHVGITVSNIERSIEFYKNVLGLKFCGQMVMEGESTDKLFGMDNCKVKVAYLNGSDKVNCPPVELIEFANHNFKENNSCLDRISISEICFKVSDIEDTYEKLKKLNVEFISEPQYFDLRNQGFGVSKAVYFKDIDGNILELIQAF